MNRSCQIAFFVLALGMFCFAGTGFGAAEKTREAGFIERVRENFAAWDLDHDGVLSADEIEKAVDNPSVKGPAAAAAAALRRAIRADSTISPLTLDRLTEIAAEKSGVTPRPPAYQAMYDSALTHITGARRELFVSGTPRVETLAQGRLGDCFLIAAVGTVAASQPDRLKSMVSELPEGKVAVRFSNGKTVTLDAPTDAEIAIGARTRNDGVWANVFEKAIGEIYLERQKMPRHVTPFSIIGVGGSPHAPLSLITGHACKRVGCEDFQRHPDMADREARLNDMRAQLADAFKSKRLVVSGTAGRSAGAVVVPGLYYNHSYGVLNYDRDSDVVTFWNPMSNGFTPRGKPGLDNGYAISHGRFEVPLSEAVMWLGAFSIETDQPAE